MTSQPAPDDAPPAPATVLVVEDDVEVNQLVGAYAQLAGFEYRSASDGESALRQAIGQVPSLVVLDVMLPDIDGFEVCRRLRTHAQTRDVPIIILSALDPQECRVRDPECRASCFLAKPFEPERLMELMRTTARRPKGANGDAIRS